VFAKRAAYDMMKNINKVKRNDAFVRSIDLQPYENVEVIQEEYKQLVKNEIEQSKKRGEK